MDDIPVEGSLGSDELEWLSENSHLIMPEQTPLIGPYANGSMAPVDLQDLPSPVQAALFAVHNGASPRTAAMRYLRVPHQLELFSALPPPAFRSYNSLGPSLDNRFLSMSHIDPHVSPSFCTVGNAAIPMTSSPPRPEPSAWDQSIRMPNNLNPPEESPSPRNTPENHLHGYGSHGHGSHGHGSHDIGSHVNGSHVDGSPPESPDVNCPDCGKSFRGRYAGGNMKRHQNYHCKDGPQKKVCEDCGRQYTRGDALASHRRRAHCGDSPT